MEDNKLLICENIVKHFEVQSSFNKVSKVHAVDNVSFFYKKRRNTWDCR